MKHLIKVLCLLTGTFLWTSCQEDYLHTAPTHATGTSTIFETTEAAELAVNGLCKLTTMQYLSSQGFNGEGTIKMYYGNYPGNHFYLNLPGWAPIINSTYHESVSSIYLYYPWYYYYRIIGNANTIIVNIDDAQGSDTEKNFIKAQALTFRAYSFMMLAQLYCYRWSDSNEGASNGLVLRLDTSTESMPLSTLKETYEQIYADLNEAISLYTVSGKTRATGDNYSPDVNVAYAAYARAALNRKDYVTASDYAGKAYTGYPLMDVENYKAGFATPTSEWIWSSYGASDENLHFFSYHAYIAYNSSAGAVRNTPKCISKLLYDQLPKTDIRHALFLDPAGYSYTLSTGQAGSTTDLDKHARALYPDIQSGATSGATIYAYMQFKIKNNAQPGVGHLNHFRSSEMYLIEAEAKYFTGDESGAQALLEKLNKTTGRDPSYSCNKTGADLLAEIKFYRAIELWGEGFDWFDAKRWGDPISRTNTDNGGNFLAALAVTIRPEEGNKWTWKIPLRETDYNDAIGLE